MIKKQKLLDPIDLYKKISASGHKMTQQRKEVLKIFIEHSNYHHLSAEDIYVILCEKKLDIGFATIYRSLELLCEIGVLTKIDFDDGCARYELNTPDPNIHHHHHLICIKCKRVIEFEEDLLEALEENITKRSSFHILNHEVKFFGYCRECRLEEDF